MAVNFGRYSLLATATQPLTAAPALWHATTYDHLAILARAYAWQITGRADYRTAVVAACTAVMGTEIDPATRARASSLTIARQLLAYVRAAAIVGLPEPLQANFKAWLTTTLTTTNSEGRSLVTSNTKKASEWGTFAGAALIAAYRYLGNTAGIASVAAVLRGWLGDRTAYTGFSFSSDATQWFPNPLLPVGVLPVGATLTIAGTARNVDGCIPEGMRYDPVAYPFPQTDNPYYALQGVIAQAVQLAEITGYEGVWEWSDQAIRRAFAWQIGQAGYTAEDDDAGMLIVINALYATTYQAPSIARLGKQDAFYDYRFAAQIPFAAPDFTALARGLWVTRTVLPTLPRTGPAWTAMYARAILDPWPVPAMWYHGAMGEQYAVAGALVAVATGNNALRSRVIAWCLSCIGTDIDPATGLRPGSLPLARNLFGVLVAADLVQMKDHLSAAQRAAFDGWLRTAICSINSEGRSVVSTQYVRPNNWGTMASSTLLAAFWWLDDQDSFQAVAAVFKGWLGDRTTYAGFTYKYDMSWQADPAAYVGINPKGSTKLWDNPYDPSMEARYVSVDGVQPEEMRRWEGVEFIFPPPQEQYCWEALQGAMVSAEVLTRAGYPAFAWEDQAIARALNFVYTAPVSYNNTVWLMGTANYSPTIFTNYDDAGARGQPVILRYKDLTGATVTATLTLHASDSSLPITGTIPCRELVSIEIAWVAADEDHILRVYAGPLECGAVESPLAPGVHVSRTGYPADGDDLWQLWIFNARMGRQVYATTTPTIPGKQIGFTDWTHARIWDAPIIGRGVPILLYPESAYATPPAAGPALRAYFAAWSVAPSATLRTIDILSAARRPLVARAAPTLAGAVETTLAPETSGWWLYHLLGVVVTTGTGPYTHIFTIGPLPTGFTAEKDFSAHGVERQSGLGIASASLSFAPGDVARLSMALVGARQTLADAPLDPDPRAAGHQEWIGRHLTLTQDGTDLGTVTAVTLSIDNALAAAPLALFGKPCGLPAGRVKLTARLQAVLTDLGWLEQALAGTPTSFALSMAHGTGDGTTGNERLDLALSDCRLNPYSPAIDTEAGLIADLSIQIGTLTATLRNSLASVLP